MSNYHERIAEAEERSREIEGQLSDPEIASQPGQYQKLAKDLGALRPIIEVGERYRRVGGELEESRAMTEDADPDLAEMARSEVESLSAELALIDAELSALFTPKDPNDEKNAIFEIRAGTGGDEAALFAADLFRMYTRYAENRGWKIEPSRTHPPGLAASRKSSR
jgi:peptide chain release factor 1